MKKIPIIIFYLSICILFTSSIFQENAFGEMNEASSKEINELIKKAKNHFLNGEHKQSIQIYDSILEIYPNNNSVLENKALALNALEDYNNSLKVFFKILQNDPNNQVALAGMGIGFGNLGEYDEALIYFNRVLEKDPNNEVVQNYKILVENTLEKYPYKSTEKPDNNQLKNKGTIPNWIKDITNWWTLEKITDENFLKSLEYMIENKIIIVPEKQSLDNDKELKMLSWTRNNLNIWSQNESSSEEFFKNIHWLIENKFIDVNVAYQDKSQEELEYEVFLFNQYLRKITNNINDERRYIEYSNPSNEVIKKFLRDYAKWNFEQQANISSELFPDPTYEVIDEVYEVKYKIYINNQPPNLPLDHVITLKETFEFWENSELITNNQKLKINFEIIKSKAEANVWITWVVRDMGEGVLGHAHVGKGIVEVALGDYRCDGNFQLYDVVSVKTIMTHELGHSIGLLHTTDKDNIMYPSYTPSYAYCLIN